MQRMRGGKLARGTKLVNHRSHISGIRRFERVKGLQEALDARDKNVRRWLATVPREAR